MDEIKSEEELLQKHRKERKDLQAEIQKLKHAVPKGDKKKKKEMTLQVAQLEAQLNEHQEQELNQFQNKVQVEQVSNDVEKLTTEDASNEHEQDQKTTKKSKAQKRREKKEQEAREREERIKAGEKENLMGPRHLEQQSFKSKLTVRDLATHEIPSDGDCLYAAVVHQLQRHNIKESVSSLRKSCADHMRSHMDDFLPFLCNTDTGDLYTPQEFEEYCDKIETTTEWGGHVEIQAMSNVLQCTIEVMQADGPSIISGENHIGPRIILSYHRHTYKLGEHYNSVVPKSEVSNADDADENDEEFR